MPDVERFLDDLIRRRRPRRFELQEEDVPVLATAIELSAGRPGADLPSEEFVARLHARLTADLEDRTTPPGDPASDAAPAAPGTRRRFLRGAAVAAASAASAVTAAATTQYLDRRSASSNSPSAVLRPDVSSWQPVMSATDLPEGTVRAFQVAGLRGFVRRDGGEVVALSGVCTHQGCLLAANIPAARLDCPCHRTSFSLTGEVVDYQLAVRPRALARIPAREQDGQIEVAAPSPPPGPASPTTT